MPFSPTTDQVPAWYDRTDRTWIDVFTEQTDRRRDREFLKFGGQRILYGELRNAVDELTTGLIRGGVRPGAVVAIWMNNCVEWVVAQWATYRAGCALLPVSSYYRVPEVLHALREAQAVALVVRSTFIGKIDAKSMVLEMLPELEKSADPLFEQMPSLRLVVTEKDWGLPGTRSISELRQLGRPVDQEALEFAGSRTAPTDVMNIIYTSGTTGVPKAGLSMHRNNMAAIECWSTFAGLDENVVLLCPAPLFGNIGCTYSSGITMYLGGRIVLTERFDPLACLHEIQAEAVTYMTGTPEMYRMILDHPQLTLTDFSTLRSAHVGGSTLEPDLAERLFQYIPDALPCYGLSECGGPNTVVGPGDEMSLRLNSVGRPLPNVRLSVRDPETKAPCEVGQVGEIWLKDAYPASCIGKGYLASPEATAKAITTDGWFRTDDLGKLDSEGYVFFEGRRSNMITVGGFNVFPAEIERVMQQDSQIDRALVVGVRDERLGSVPAAFVVAGPEVDLEQLRRNLSNQLSSQKLPRFIWPIADSEIPRTPTGKIRIADLQKRAARMALS